MDRVSIAAYQECLADAKDVEALINKYLVQ